MHDPTYDQQWPCWRGKNENSMYFYSLMPWFETEKTDFDLPARVCVPIFSGVVYEMNLSYMRVLKKKK